MNSVQVGEAVAPPTPTNPPAPPVQSAPPPHEQKHFNWPWHRWLLVAFAVVGFLSVIAYTMYRPQFLSQTHGPQPTPTQVVETIPTPTPNPTENWKTYTNSKYKYSFSYPSTVRTEISEVDYSVILESDTEGPSYPFFYVSVIPKEGVQYETFNIDYFIYHLEELLSLGVNKQLSIEEADKIYTRLADTVIDQKKAMVFIVKGLKVFTNIEEKRVAIKNGDFTYIIGGYYKPTGNLETFDQILSTFRFDDLTASKFLE